MTDFDDPAARAGFLRGFEQRAKALAEGMESSGVARQLYEAAAAAQTTAKAAASKRQRLATIMPTGAAESTALIRGVHIVPRKGKSMIETPDHMTEGERSPKPRARSKG